MRGRIVGRLKQLGRNIDFFSPEFSPVQHCLFVLVLMALGLIGFYGWIETWPK